MPPLTERQAVQQIIANDPLFHVEDRVVRGETLPVFVNAPDSLRSLLKLSADRYAASELMLYREERMTYGAFAERVWRFAHHLEVEYQIAPGDRVAIAMPNNPEYLIAVMAIASLGAVVVYLNAWWTTPELEYGFQDSGARLAIVDDERATRIVPFCQTLAITLIKTDALRQFDKAIPMTSSSSGRMPPSHDIQPDDDYAIMYTSGSTGHPKGVVLTHRSTLTALWSWLMIGPLLEATGQQRAPALDAVGQPLPLTNLVTVPFFHISGINACFLLNLCVGGKVIILPKWNADEAVALIDQEKVTRFWGVPTMSAELSAAADKAGSTLNTLGTIDAGGAKRPPSQVKGLAGQFSQAQPATGFGMTETNGLGIRMAGDEYIAHPGAAGRLTPPVQAMRIVDEDGSPVPSGDVGELQLKSAANMRCYLNQPEATAATLSEGWLKTGDLAYADETGLVFIVGRKKDIVIRGGENIACTEVEAALYQVSSGIKEASVFSIPDDRLGETVGAALYVEETVDIAMLNGDLKTILAKFKLPERYWIYAERLPRGATEKIDKRRIRDSCLAGEVPEADTSSR